MQPKTEAQIAALAAALEAGTLAVERWHHAEHLEVATLWLREAGGDVGAATDRLRAALTRFLAAKGIEATETSGYHETITRGWLELIARVARGRETEPLADVAHDVVAALGDKRLLLRWWSREALMSSEARRRWVEPELPLPDRL